jgi:hypothetical protein
VDGMICDVEQSTDSEIICETPPASASRIPGSGAHPTTKFDADVAVTVTEVHLEDAPPLDARALKEQFYEPSCDLGRYGNSVNCDTGLYDPLIAQAFLWRGYTDCDDLMTACLYSSYSPPPPTEASTHSRCAPFPKYTYSGTGSVLCACASI